MRGKDGSAAIADGKQDDREDRAAVHASGPVQWHVWCLWGGHYDVGLCLRGVEAAANLSDDYLSRPAQNEAGPSRYPGSFELAHDASGVTVSTSVSCAR